jgi:hypothetical protein
MLVYKIPKYQDMLDLVQAKLAVVSVNNDLSTFKYHRRVMYEQLWDTSEFLMECRGITFNNKTGELVLLPFRKSFNYTERGTWQDVPLNTPVLACKKFNGFMGQITKYQGEFVFGTTGSTKSDFVKMFRESYLKTGGTPHKLTTDLYEVILKKDPHIVEEQEQGCVPLGLRCHITGEFYPVAPFEQPYALEDILELAKTDKGEGWMLYSNTQKEAVKIKTDYYVGKKKLMRMSKNNVLEMYKNPGNTIQSLPDYWKFAVKEITKGFRKSLWSRLSDQQRREVLEAMDEKRNGE